MPKFYSYICRKAFLRLNLVPIFFNVSIIICCSYAGFNSLVVFYLYLLYFSSNRHLESALESRPLTFVFQLQPQRTTYAFIGPSMFENRRNLYKNSINNYTVQVDSQISVEFMLSDAPLTLQLLFLKLQSSFLKL